MNQARVVLVNPRMTKRRGARLPLSLLALGSALEGHSQYDIVDGNVDRDAVELVLALLSDGKPSVLAVTVMPGPQVAPAVEISSAVRQARPEVPIVWGGFFPTLYPDSAINAAYVDFVVRGQGEVTLNELLDRLSTDRSTEQAFDDVQGLTWKQNGHVIHNPNRAFVPSINFSPYPYHRLRNIERYFPPSFFGSKTGVHQSALGCRYRCSFCGVVSMFDGYTNLDEASRLHDAVDTLHRRYGADSLQFYDHNFFDKEENSIDRLDVLGTFGLPWWCYARADTLAHFSARTWQLIRRSRLTMTYIGAEASSDRVLRSMKKGTKVDHVIEVAHRCRENNVIPEFSFVLGGPEDPEGEIENTFRFVRKLKTINPDAEIILYYYSPTPQRSAQSRYASSMKDGMPVLERYGPDGPTLPTTPEEWTTPQWLDYVCHRDAPWLSPPVKRRVKDFSTVLYSRFPTVQDFSTPLWKKNLLKGLAGWRYSTGTYAYPRELELVKRFVPLREPQRESI